MTEDEKNDAEDSAREEERQRQAVVRNQLADAISTTLNTLSVALLNSAPPGKTVVLNASTFTGTFARQSITPDPARPPPVLSSNPRAAPQAVFVDPAVSDPVDALGSGGGQGFVVPSNLPALQGVESVETTVIHFPVSIRDGGPPPARGQVSRVVSPSTSLTLRVNGLPRPVPSGGGVEILLQSPVTFGSATSSACGVVEAACDNATAAMQLEVDALAARCEHMAGAAIRPGSGRDAMMACLATLASLDANLTAQADRCAALPAACSGRGNCTDGRCQCLPGWYGLQCETQPSCRFWEKAGANWSTAGCRMRRIRYDGPEVNTGTVVCACDHLTEVCRRLAPLARASSPVDYAAFDRIAFARQFAVVASALVRPDAFFEALTRLNINLPVPLSWKDFLMSLQLIQPMHVVVIVVTLVVMQLLLAFAASADDKSAYTTVPPSWRLWIGDVGGKGVFGGLFWLVAAMALFLCESQHLVAVLLVNHAASSYGYSEMLVLAYQLTLSEMLLVVTFWGTEANQDDPMLQLWASSIASVTRYAAALISTRAFADALLPTRASETERVPRPVWTTDTFGYVMGKIFGYIPFGGHILEFLVWLTSDAEQAGWILVLRQTVPDPKAARKARAPKMSRGATARLAEEEAKRRSEDDDVRVSPQPGWWDAESATLLTDPGADSFCSDLLRAVPPRFCRAADGSVRYRIVGYSKPRGPFGIFGRRTLCSFVWKQRQVGQPPPLGPPPPPEAANNSHVPGFELAPQEKGMCGCGGEVQRHLDASAVIGLRRCHEGSRALLACGADAHGAPTLLLGQAYWPAARPGSLGSGGLGGALMQDGRMLTFDKVELFMERPWAHDCVPEPEDEATSPPPSPPERNDGPAAATGTDPPLSHEEKALDQASAATAQQLEKVDDQRHEPSNAVHRVGGKVGKAVKRGVHATGRYAVNKAEDKASRLRDIVGTAEDSIAAARERAARGDLVTTVPLPMYAFVRMPDGAVGFYVDVSASTGSSECSPDVVTASHEKEESSLPRFVAVEKLALERLCCGLWRSGAASATYSLQEAELPHAVQPHAVVHPATAHRAFAEWHAARLARGDAHGDLVEALAQACHVPEAWRDATSPYCGAFAPAKYRTAWRLNGLLQAILILLLTMDYLTLQATIPFVAVAETIFLGFVVEPVVAALWLLVEVTAVLFALVLLKKLVERTALDTALERVLARFSDALSDRSSQLSGRVSARHTALRSTNTTGSRNTLLLSRASSREQRRSTSRRSMSMVDEEDSEDYCMSSSCSSLGAQTGHARSRPTLGGKCSSTRGSCSQAEDKEGLLHEPSPPMLSHAKSSSGGSRVRFSLSSARARSKSFQMLDESEEGVALDSLS